MRKIIDIVLTVNLLALALYVGYLWWVGHLVIEYVEDPTVAQDAAFESPGVVFGIVLKEAVVAELGQPTEGFTPTMLLEVFPGLALTDFEGVEASVGQYEVVNGGLELVTPRGALLHSAAGAVSRRGFETLLRTVSARLQIDLAHSGTITQVMGAISQ